MDRDVARWLVSPQAQQYIAKAEAMDDPTSLRAGEVMRRDLAGERAAAVLDLVSLRRRAATKLHGVPHPLFLTHDGLEQATRWEVARWRARAIAAHPVSTVTDLGCGLGIDSLACLEEGLEVVGIERDPVTALFAQANLGGTSSGASVLVQAVEDTALDPTPGRGVYLDPARRTAKGRSWKVSDLSPSWEFLGRLLDQGHDLCVAKLAPGFPRSLLPAHLDVTWVSHHHQLVETTLWSCPGSTGQRSAVVLTPADPTEARLLVGEKPPPAGPIATYLYEADPAVSRSGALGTLCAEIGAHPLSDHTAYLSSQHLVPTPFAVGFEVLDVMDYSPKALRSWAKRESIGALEIKVAGSIDVDPAILRRSLNLRGSHQATVVLASSAQGSKILQVRRLQPWQPSSREPSA